MEMDEDFVRDLAKERAGNYLRWQNFVLDREIRNLLDPPKDWCIVYTSNRDSDLLTESNEHILRKRLEGLLGDLEEGADVSLAEHSCWAHGYRTGLYLRVYKEGEATPAFRVYAQALHDLEQYPILDEDEYSGRVSEQTSRNVATEVDCIARSHETTKKYQEAGDQAPYLVEDWLEEEMPGELEDRDGNGGCPHSSAVLKAMRALGMVEVEELWPGR